MNWYKTAQSAKQLNRMTTIITRAIGKASRKFMNTDNKEEFLNLQERDLHLSENNPEISWPRISIDFHKKPFQFKNNYYITGEAAKDSIGIYIDLYPKTTFNDIFWKLKEVIRHELEHLTTDTFQSAKSTLLSEVKPWTQAENYLSNPQEVQAWVVSLAYRAKKTGEDLRTIIDQILDMYFKDFEIKHGKEALIPVKDKIRNLWLNYAQTRNYKL